LDKIYDPITEDVYNKNQDGDLVNKSFYYFNMQKDQEEYLRDLQFKKQEKIANKNRQITTSNSIRTFRKQTRNFTVFDTNSEFNQYPNLDPYKFKFDEGEYDINALLDK
jgi:hypothetical protein